MARFLLALALLAPLPCRAQSASAEEFVDPSAEDMPEPAVEHGASVTPPRPPPHGPIDPPRQTDRWELAATVSAFFPILDGGVGFITRGHALYRFDLPLMVRADLMPLAFSFAEDGRGAGAFGLLSIGLDLHAFGLSAGVGAASTNEHDRNVAPFPPRPGEPVSSGEPQPGAMTAVVFGARVGVSDGLALWLRSGLAIDHRSGAAKFAVFEGWAQVPFGHVWALTVRGSWTMSGNAELRVGMRAWLSGRGEAGSVALLLDGGLGRLVYRPPTRGRGYPDPIDHVGPGFGVGVAWRL